MINYPDTHQFYIDNPAEQARLINVILRTCYEESESWQHEDLGMHLAYLTLAVSDGKIDSFVQWETCPAWGASTYKTRQFFEKLFPKSHHIWFYIKPLYRGDIPETNEPG